MAETPEQSLFAVAFLVAALPPSFVPPSFVPQIVVPQIVVPQIVVPQIVVPQIVVPQIVFKDQHAPLYARQRESQSARQAGQDLRAKGDR